MLVSCKEEKEDGKDVKLFQKEFNVGKDITSSDVTEFYYTYSNINYNAFYQRYYLYAKDGSHYFFHETRERKNEYGPATEEDTTAKGTVLLTNEQWAKFFELISGGTVVEKAESAESGDSGPWFYLYWKGDKGKYCEYSFTSYGAQKTFEDYCAAFAADPVPLSVEAYQPVDDSSVGNWAGSFIEVSGNYQMEIGAAVDGQFPAKLNLSWMYSSSDGGMYTDLVDIEGKISLSEEGIAVIEGKLDDGSSENDKKFKAVIAKNGEELKMVVIEADSSRLPTGLTLLFSRE